MKDQYDYLNSKIKQLLKEASDAKEKGRWKKAQELLFEARMLNKNNVELKRSQ